MRAFNGANMDLLLLLKAAAIGVVEGLTEFLPVSSTGHIILAESLLGFNDARGKLFAIVIQSGAIFALVWEYRSKIAQTLLGLFSERSAQRFTINLIVAFLPLAILGLLFQKTIKAHLFNAPVVAAAFILGGLIILWVEHAKLQVRVREAEDVSLSDAFKLGIAQAFALIPGMSRSGSTIIGGLLFGLSRRAATEFSFFLAIPTLLIASVYQLYKERELVVLDEWSLWAVGFAAAFLSAFVAVRGFLHYVSTHSFALFAWYRIAFGILVLITWRLDLISWAD